MSIFYVSTAGNNGNPCAADAKDNLAKRNVADGLGCLSAGDTLRIQAGTYTDAADKINSSRDIFNGGVSSAAPTIIEANPGDTVILQPADDGYQEIVYMNSKNNVTVRNFILDGHDVQIHVMRVSNSNGVTYSGNEVKNAVINGILWGGGTNGRILNNRIHDNSHSVAFDLHGYACYCDAPGLLIDGNEMDHNARYAVHYYPGTYSGATIRNNLFHDNGVDQTATDILITGSGHQIYNNVFYNTEGGGISANNGSDDLIYNNTIYNEPGNTSGLGAGIYIGGNATNFIVKNNLIISSGSGINDQGVGTITCLSCNILSGTASLFFVNTGLDFHLKNGASAIDTGVDLSSVFNTDKDGISRPQGSAWDIGAYEFFTPVTGQILLPLQDNMNAKIVQIVNF